MHVKQVGTEINLIFETPENHWPRRASSVVHVCGVVAISIVAFFLCFFFLTVDL